ncbi:hypothetical protein N7533_001789 [Penicillium manginii]|uniref:uncharacterized protein n=1 Tax=Penicillium manginii TaxID=203109 RepID=UPI0025475EB6|nr:uncharacterized protein N7533_001789 [Penicillium manginii]KAJ5763108.1 hypothetical protein N7533_001789 [Penicillium manginii]
MFSTIAPAIALRRSAAELRRNGPRCHRGLLTLAIETSCDDTSVAIVEKTNTSTSSKAKIHFLENITADSRAHRGIHPILALESHQENLANLLNKALKSLPPTAKGQASICLADGSSRRKPNFISATRGPGMRSNLSVGLDTGKALSVAWQIPMVGVHHMQAHLLTPRLVSCLEAEENCTTTAAASAATPAFPFLSILVSGGHTILVHSKSLTEHRIMASSEDIAIGEALDKSAREIVPADVLAGAESTMYGKTLERFVFPNGAADFAEYRAPRDRGEEVAGMKRASARGGEALDADLSRDERVELGREIMRVCFEHLGSRTVIALEQLRLTAREEIGTLVVSGGVAANRFLMAVLRSFLDERGFGRVRVVAPPPYLCTDNAAMVGWAGIEMFEAGWETDFSVRALRKWTLDSEAGDGGVLGPGGWVKRDVLNLKV